MSHEKEKSLDFFIFGHPCGMSPSPEIHNVGFAENGYKHRYLRFDAEDFKDVMEKIRLPSTGGGSVTIPHKESVLPEMDVLSESARRIGAVNTITKQPDGKLHGDNTDWLGIKEQIEARLRARGKTLSPKGGAVGLLCGAGGTAKAAAYAFEQMGCANVIIMNRTLARADELAKEFGTGFVASVPEDAAGTLAGLGRLDFVVCTLPGSTGYVLPDEVATFVARHKPIVVEASYIPRHTAFVKQVAALGCEVIEGIEMLFEQGCAQCATWTASAAPRQAIATSLLSALFTEGSAHPAASKMEPLDAPPTAIRLEANASMDRRSKRLKSREAVGAK
jgi:pentafunctional AROM polypeptide